MTQENLNVDVNVNEEEVEEEEEEEEEILEPNYMMLKGIIGQLRNPDELLDKTKNQMRLGAELGEELIEASNIIRQLKLWISKEYGFENETINRFLREDNPIRWLKEVLE